MSPKDSVTGGKKITTLCRQVTHIFEVMSVVKSVSRWIWGKYYAGSKVKRGVMNLPSDLNIKQRQSLAAERTHQIRREKTKERVINACRLLLQKSEELNITTVAKATRLCRKTVRRYFYDIHSLVRPSEGIGILPISSLLGLIKSGPYAVHQITAVDKYPLVDTSEKCKAIGLSRAPKRWAAYLNVIDG
nr:hypothetical protein [uncultured Vibrio sp.]